MVLWTSGFVLMTLLINGPLISPLMTWLGLNGASKVKQQVGGPLVMQQGGGLLVMQQGCGPLFTQSCAVPNPHP